MTLIMRFNYAIDFESLESTSRPIHELIGENLAYIRRIKNRSQHNVATQIGVSKQSLISWEKGRHSLPISKGAKMAVLYRIPLVFALRNTPYAERFGMENTELCQMADYVALLLSGLEDEPFALHIKVLTTVLGSSLQAGDEHSTNGYRRRELVSWISQHYPKMVADNMRSFRRENRLSLEDFGALVGVSSETVRNYEAAKTQDFPALVLVRFSISTGLSPYVLINGAPHHGLRLAVDNRVQLVRDICKKSDINQLSPLIPLLERSQAGTGPADKNQQFFT